MSKSVWETIKEIVDSGQCPEITLHPSQEIKFKLAPGRPKNPPDRQYFRHYASFDGITKRPRCKAKGCDRYLKQNQAAFCSDDCIEKSLSAMLPLFSNLPYEKIEELVRLALGLEYRIFRWEDKIVSTKKLANMNWKRVNES